MSVTVAQISAKISLDDAGYQAGIKKCQAAMDTFTNGMMDAGKKMALAITAPLALLAGHAIAIASDFEQSMNVLQATSGASAAQLEVLRQKAKDLGADMTLPGTSAVDAAKAMLELNKAGLSLDDTMGAVKGTLQLSAAAQISNAEAATQVGDALNAFSLSGEKAGKVADLLTGAANAATGSSTQMSEALAQSGQAFAMLKVPVEDAVTSIALMAKNSLKGSDAGTSLKVALLALNPASKQARDAMKLLHISFFDANDQFVGMRRAAEILSKAMAGLTDKNKQTALQIIGGTDALRTLNILAKEGAGGWDKMAAAVGKSGQAAAMAAAQMKGLPGAIGNIKSAIETAEQAGVEPFLVTLTDLGNGVADLINKFSNAPAETRKTIVILGAFAAAIGPVLIVIAQLIKAFGVLRGAWTAFQGARAAGSLVAGLGGPIAIAILAIAGLAIAWETNWGSIRDITATAVQFIVEAVSEFAAGLGTAWAGITDIMSGQWQRGWDQIKEGTQRSLSSLGVAMDRAADGDVKRLQERLRKEREVRAASTAQVKKDQEKITKPSANQPDFRSDDDPLKQEAKSFAEAWAAARLKFSLAKQGITKDVQDLAAQFSHQSFGKVKGLAELNRSIDDINKVMDQQKNLREALATAQKVDNLANQGESDQLQQLAGQFTKLNVAQLRQLATTQKHTKDLNDARDSMKKFHDELDRVNAAILDQRSSNFSSDEAERLKDLKKAYPEASQAQLQFMLGQKRIEQTGRDLTDRFIGLRYELGSNAAGSVKAKVAWELFGEGLLKQGFTIDEVTDKLHNLSKDHQTALNNITQLEEASIWQTALRSVDDMRLSLLQLKTSATDTTMQAAFQLFGEQFKLMGVEGQSAEELFKRLPKDLQLVAKDAGDVIRQTKIQENMQTVVEGLHGVITNAFLDLKHGVGGVFKSIIGSFDDMLAQMAAKYLSSQIVGLLTQSIPQLFGLLGGIAGGGGTTGIAGSIKPGTGGFDPLQLFHRATGGPFIGGQDMWVGEHGPELVRFGRGGNVVPNHALGSAGNTTVNVYVTTPDVRGFRQSTQQIGSDIVAAMRSAGSRQGGS